MRLLDAYALNCAAKIDKPFIYESFFPLMHEKYITFQAQTPMDSRNYHYWQDVIDIVAPVLQTHNIRVMQIGLPNEMPMQRIIDIRGQTSINQLAYVLKRSMLHFGPDSFGIHLATSFDTPVVGLYSCSQTEVAGPHFGSPEKQILFKAYERVGNKKPSCAPQEGPKSINTIKPEEIAAAILKLLRIEFTVPFETVYTGSRYSNMTVRELVPNSLHTLPMPEQPVELRLDLHYDEKIFMQHLGYWRKAVIVTDRPVPIPLLQQFKPNIALLAYHIKENDDPKFAEAVVAAGIPMALLTRLPEEILMHKKMNYYEFGLINRIVEPSPEVVASIKAHGDNLFYRSCKLIASNGSVYASLPDLEAGTPLQADFEYRRVIDSPKFWQDLDFYTIVKKL